MNGQQAGSSSGLGRFYGYKETFGNESIWVDIPKQRNRILSVARTLATDR